MNRSRLHPLLLIAFLAAGCVLIKPFGTKAGVVEKPGPFEMDSTVATDDAHAEKT